jgi:hypothetical protein
MRLKTKSIFSRGLTNLLCTLCLSLMLAPPAVFRHISQRVGFMRLHLSLMNQTMMKASEVLDARNECGFYMYALTPSAKINYGEAKWRDE